MHAMWHSGGGRENLYTVAKKFGVSNNEAYVALSYRVAPDGSGVSTTRGIKKKVVNIAALDDDWEREHVTRPRCERGHTSDSKVEEEGFQAREGPDQGWGGRGFVFGRKQPVKEKTNSEQDNKEASA